MITAEALKATRKTLGETQEQFAKRFGVDRSTYTAWENNRLPREGTAPMLIERILAELGPQPNEST